MFLGEGLRKNTRAQILFVDQPLEYLMFQMTSHRNRLSATGSKIYQCSFDEAYEASAHALEEGNFQIVERKKNSIKAISPSSICRGRGILEVTFSIVPNGVEVRAIAYSGTRLEWLDLGKFKGIVSKYFSSLEKQIKPLLSNVESPTEVTEREIIREKEVIVKIKCSYCNNLFSETLDKCPHCGKEK